MSVLWYPWILGYDGCNTFNRNHWFSLMKRKIKSSSICVLSSCSSPFLIYIIWFFLFFSTVTNTLASLTFHNHLPNCVLRSRSVDGLPPPWQLANNLFKQFLVHQTNWRILSVDVKNNTLLEVCAFISIFQVKTYQAKGSHRCKYLT